MTECFC